MCGIAGAFSKQGIDEVKMHGVTDVMQHRGPDSGGYYTSRSGKVFLGHRRLSIIDLSVTANQPMHSADGRYVMVYNGEVYNFNELRAKLPGKHWQTHSDTEVILELFVQYGPVSFSWLNGIFAFAIYDTLEDKLILCRDQLGIKPLFISRSENDLMFASELKAIATAQTGINKEAIPYFLHLGYIPQPMTIYTGIEKFPAGYFGILDIKNSHWHTEQYWSAADHYLANPVLDEQQALNIYKEKLFAAVNRQMISDVPLGTFLSGGIDSSLVSAVAANTSSRQVNTFSIGFEEAAFDESQYAQQVAEHLKTAHHLFRVKLDDVLELVPEFISVYDEPFADSSAFPTMLVSRLARQHVTVTLSGDGGDELFQGYGMYAWARRLNDPKVRALRKPLLWASQFMNERYQRAGKLFGYPSPSRIASHIFSQEQYFFSEQELYRMLIKPAFHFDAINELPQKGQPQEKQAFWDLEHYLKDDLLVKVDRASMRYSLETRVPLLDMDIVEFALNVPMELKIREGYGTKYLMKKVLYEMVPREIFERPKRGFAIPLNKWLRHELKPLTDKYLNDELVRELGVVNPAYVQSLLQEYRNGTTYFYNRVWVLLVLHWWYATQHKKA
ncbi:asparagine synthase (glutamine-hydrolyzing) [Chitinophagaceae bacterium MMS25-I14]